MDNLLRLHRIVKWLPHRGATANMLVHQGLITITQKCEIVIIDEKHTIEYIKHIRESVSGFSFFVFDKTVERIY